MDPRVEKELNRVVGAQSFQVSDVETANPANPRIKLETMHATYELPQNRFLIFLEKLPDQIGVDGLREAISERFSTGAEK